MKRKDLTVGDELFWAKPSEWDNFYSSHPGDRVVVLSTAPHAEYRSRYGEFYETSKGNGVLVAFVKADGTRDPRKQVVQLGHLRGPYEATKADFERRKAERDAQNRADHQRRDEAVGRANDVVKRLEDLGYRSAYNTHDSTGRVNISAANLAALLDRLEQAEQAEQALIGERDTEGE